MEKDTPHAGGREGLVTLDPDHPGFRDPIYRRRRNAIAQLAFDYRAPATVPEVRYTPEEHGVWREVWNGLSPLHARYACEAYLESSKQVHLDREEVPQLWQVNAQLKQLSGFQMQPVGGLVSSRQFLGHLGQTAFLSTQYMRHHSVPFYTPEPDVVHELVGHAATLAHPGFAQLNLAFGRAAERASEADLQRVERVYWYTLEFGVTRERSGIKAYGAGLLSSFGELERFEGQSKLLPFDLAAMAAQPYDPTQYQAVLFVAPSFDHVVRDVTAWLQQF